MAALVVPDFLAVHPDDGGVIHGFEVQEHVSAAPVGGNVEESRVPNDFVHALVVNPRQLALIGKGHVDAVAQALVLPSGQETLPGVVKVKLPFTVEAQPFGTDELRPRIFGSRVFRFHRQAFLKLHIQFG